MARLLMGFMLILAGASIGQAQATPAAVPPYVASPMRKTVDDTVRRTGFRPGGFEMVGGTIRQIFQLAYPSEAGDPIGAPDWMNTERFDLTVRFEGAQTLPPDQMRTMFQEIFSNQLKLKVHYERRNTPTYDMVVARSDGRLGQTVRKLDVDCDGLRDAARRDIDEAVAFYMSRGAATPALEFLDRLEQAFAHIARHPHAGSPRYAHILDLAGLRSWLIDGHPYLVFYVERHDHIDVWRVLHGDRDIPAWIHAEK